MSRKCVSAWLLIYICVFAVSFSTLSCISTKSVTYFNNLPDSSKIQLEKLQPPPFVVQVNDLLDIRIGGENEKTVQYINQYFTGGTNGMQATVDIDGNIELPKIGKIKVAGLSKEVVRDTIAKAYKEYLLDPIVSVNFGNFRFSVMGEVKGPGAFDVPAEKVTIFEALARAGDLTPYAKWNNVKIIREVNGERKILSINMNDKDILNSPDYYITRYDLIYVESKSVKLTTENVQRTVTYISAFTSLMALLIALLRK
jgi:polysaccharide export outer membrane protein